MARRAADGDRPGDPAALPHARQMGRLTNLIALLLVKGEPQQDQIRSLLSAGFTNTEIAKLLGMTANAVNVAVHRLRKRK